MLVMVVFFIAFRWIFFFSSRRRHTRWTGDWSSDVCSSDLDLPGSVIPDDPKALAAWSDDVRAALRSEERRVGKGVEFGSCRSRHNKNFFSDKLFLTSVPTAYSAPVLQTPKATSSTL